MIVKVKVDGITGTLNYLYNYPKAIYKKKDKSQTVVKFEPTPQRVGITTDDGKVLHFTIPKEVIYMNEVLFRITLEYKFKRSEIVDSEGNSMPLNPEKFLAERGVTHILEHDIEANTLHCEFLDPETEEVLDED